MILTVITAPCLFFAHTASLGSLDEDSLTLIDVDPITLASTVRPSRETAALPTSHFVDRWADRFGGDAPNGILTARQGDQRWTPRRWTTPER